MYRHDKGHADDTSDRRDVADEIEIELVVKRGVDRIYRTDRKQRIAIRRRTHDGFGGDIGGSPRPILDDKWLLAEPLRQPLPYQTRDNALRAAWCKTHDYTHRSRGVG